MRTTTFILLSFFACTAAAQSSGDDVFVETPVEDLSEFVWEKRPIVVFADSPNDPAFREQIELLEGRIPELAERDVVVLIDTDPQARGPLRRKLRPRGFALVLVGKDGSVKLRKPKPWDVREISRVIDKMPMRQQEIRDRRAE